MPKRAIVVAQMKCAAVAIASMAFPNFFNVRNTSRASNTMLGLNQLPPRVCKPLSPVLWQSLTSLLRTLILKIHSLTRRFQFYCALPLPLRVGSAQGVMVIDHRDNRLTLYHAITRCNCTRRSTNSNAP